MFFLYELNQPVAFGPVGQPLTTGPVGTHERESDCKRMDRIADSPVGSTEILDLVKQTESSIQTDFMKIGTINEPASLSDTPPSSDSGAHSLGEQWENMSTSSIDMESEQRDQPTVVQWDGVLVTTVCLRILRKMKLSIITGRTVC